MSIVSSFLFGGLDVAHTSFFFRQFFHDLIHCVSGLMIEFQFFVHLQVDHLQILGTNHVTLTSDNPNTFP